MKLSGSRPINRASSRQGLCHRPHSIRDRQRYTELSRRGNQAAFRPDTCDCERSRLPRRTPQRGAQPTGTQCVLDRTVDALLKPRRTAADRSEPAGVSLSLLKLGRASLTKKPINASYPRKFVLITFPRRSLLALLSRRTQVRTGNPNDQHSAPVFCGCHTNPCGSLRSKKRCDQPDTLPISLVLDQ